MLPNFVRNAAIAGAFGLMLGVAAPAMAQKSGQPPAPAPDLTPPPEQLPPPREPQAPASPPPAAQPQQPGRPQAGQAGEPVESDRLAAARDLLAATNTEAQFSMVIPMMFGQLKQSIPPSGPKMQEELDRVFGEIQKQFIDRRTEVLDQIAQLYARRFTAEEMRSLANFYRSPMGQKFIAAMPELTAEAMKLGNAWGRQIALDAERKVREEMRRRGFDL